VMSCIMVISSCKEKCDYPVYIEVSFVDPGTKIWLNIDSGKVEKYYEIDDGHYMDRKDRLKLLTYCSSDTLVPVKCKINNYETTFVINNREVKGAFVGMGNRKVHVFYDWYGADGDGLGDFRFDH
jgi:hypothetical protein